MRTAVDSTTVSMALRPAALIVSPDSTREKRGVSNKKAHKESERILTDEVHDAIGDSQCACCLDAAAQLNNLGLELLRTGGVVVGGSGAAGLRLQLGEEVGSQAHEAGADRAADEVCAGGVLALLGNLDLELTRAEAELRDHLAARALGGSASVGSSGVDGRIVLLDLIPPRDSEIDAALADKRGDVGGGQEDEGNGQVLDEGNVEAVLSPELDVCALEQVQGRLVQSALCNNRSATRKA